MRWPWTRPEPQPDPDPPEDDLTGRMRDLAEHYRRNPGVQPWTDSLPARPVDPWNGPTGLYPVVTPAQRMRGEGGGWR